MTSQARTIAESIRKTVRQGFFADHEYRVLGPGAVGVFDRRFYRERQAAFEAEGFSHLADVEDASLARVQGVRGVIRIMLDAAGEVSAAFYRARPPLVQRVMMRLFVGMWTMDTIDLESAFDDGSYLVTTTAAASQLKLPAQIAVEYLPPDSAPAFVLAQHRLRIEAFRRAHPDVRTLSRPTLEAQLDGQRELDRLKAEHARSRGYTVDWNEFMALGGEKMPEELRQAVWTELRAMAQEPAEDPPG